MPETKYTTPEQIAAMRRVIARAKQKGGGGPRRGRRGRGAGRKGKPVLKTAGWFLFAAVVLPLLVILASVVTAKQRGETPAVLGYQLYRIESGSMEPTLPVGTVILSRRPGDAGRLQVKDIVTFETSAGTIVTHRIIAVITAESGAVGYRTKGDNPLNSPDQELLTPERVIAVLVAAIPLI